MLQFYAMSNPEDKTWQYWLPRLLVALLLLSLALTWRCAEPQCWERTIIWIFFVAYIPFLFLEGAVVRDHSLFGAYAFVALTITVLLSHANYSLSLRTCSLQAQKLEGACRHPSRIDDDVMQVIEDRKYHQGLLDDVTMKKEVETAIDAAMRRCLYLYTGEAASFNFIHPDERIMELRKVCNSSSPLDRFWNIWFEQSLEEAFTPTGKYPTNEGELEELWKNRN
jgi:hypothetical protein